MLILLLSTPSAPVLDDSTVSQLCEMGFPLEACRKAVYYTGNTGIDAAMNWVIGHMNDPGVYWVLGVKRQ